MICFTAVQHVDELFTAMKIVENTYGALALLEKCQSGALNDRHWLKGLGILKGSDHLADERSKVQFLVSDTYNNDDSQLFPFEIMVLSQYYNSLSAFLRCGSRFPDSVQHVLNYA